jgi:bifunctional oligoribonuclease and PAP phosphatase NrnA
MSEQQTNQTNQQSNEVFDKAKSFLETHHNFLLASHARTDGDDLGSMLAITKYLQSMGKKATPAALGGVPESLKFLPLQQMVIEEIPNDNYDAIILFGCNKKERTGINAIVNAPLPVLNIDHHPDNQNFGDVNMIDATKSSVAEFVYDFLVYLKAPIDTDIAKCLLTGILTDTGSFMHSNTQPSTLMAAAELMKHGARIDKIHEFTYKSKDPRTMKAWARAIENTRVDTKNRIAISVMTEEDLKEIGDVDNDAFGGFVETLNKIPGTRFAVFLRQDGDIVKGSMRSEERKETDVAELARILGGGGHKLAAGFEVKGKIRKQADGSWKVE